MASKQYNPFTDFRELLTFWSPFIKPINEVSTRRCTVGVLGAAGFCTAYEAGLTGLLRPRNYQKMFSSASDEHLTLADSFIRCCFEQFTCLLEWYLLIPRESAGWYQAPRSTKPTILKQSCNCRMKTQ